MPYRGLKHIEDLEIYMDVPLSPLTSFRIGGPAHLLLFPRTIKALELTMSYLCNRSIQYKVLGEGSNLLISDRGIDVVIAMARLNHIYYLQARDLYRSVLVEAGLRLRSLLSWSIRNGLGGIEGLSGIPASIGGAICMNAGTTECSMADLIEAVLFTGPEGSQWLSRDQLKFGYRFFESTKGTIISAARIRLESSDPEGLRATAREVMQRRRLMQPVGRPSAGCVFRNPPGDSAGRLIEMCGLKGFSIGDAEVSKRHANFVINRGKARAIEVMDLLEVIRERVMAETNIGLVPELCIWGPDL